MSKLGVVFGNIKSLIEEYSTLRSKIHYLIAIKEFCDTNIVRLTLESNDRDKLYKLEYDQLKILKEAAEQRMLDILKMGDDDDK